MKHFANRTSIGILQMKEHSFWSDDRQIDEFIESLHELIGV